MEERKKSFQNKESVEEKVIVKGMERLRLHFPLVGIHFQIILCIHNLKYNLKFHPRWDSSTFWYTVVTLL